MRYNQAKIRALISEAYDDEELTTFCHDHFREVVDRFGSGMGKSQKVLLLVEYCSRREEMEYLLEKVKTERPKKYEAYKAQLEGGGDIASKLDEVREEASRFASVFESISSRVSPPEQASSESSPLQEKTHPLAGSPQEVKHWFLTELRPEEQVFVMTAALFKGLERQELAAIYKDLLSLLKPAETSQHKEAQHD